MAANCIYDSNFLETEVESNSTNNEKNSKTYFKFNRF